MLYGKFSIFRIFFVTLICLFISNALAQKKESGTEDDSLVWVQARNLTVEGKGWPNTLSFYDRLSAKAKSMVPPKVWNLSHQTAGLCVRFITDADILQVRWTLTNDRLALPHMPATGVSGLDFYVKTQTGKWRWLNVARPLRFPDNESILFQNIPSESREYMLYLPLYNGIESLEIGVPAHSSLLPGTARALQHQKPLIFYGTSITQGGCASRPGMCHVNILGRWFDRPVINLGFSGNGKMEIELAQLLTELDPAVYVLDCLPNMNDSLITARFESFVKLLRNVRPHTPILLVEDRTYANAFLIPFRKKRNKSSRLAMRKAYGHLLADGLENLYYLNGEKLLNANGEDTVDGSHPTDLGFMHQARVFYQTLKPILEESGE